MDKKMLDIKMLDDQEIIDIKKILGIQESINYYDFLKEWCCIPIKTNKKEKEGGLYD